MKLYLPADKVSLEISPNDDMAVGEARQWYFQAGEDALKNVLWALRDDVDKVKKVLDMPCGYGRVLRWLKVYFPEAEMTACDLNRDAVDFCANTFNVRGINSAIEFSEIDLVDQFELIWCGSLLTHLDGPQWDAFLRFATSHLEEGGTLVFTTHGRIAAHLAYQNHPLFCLEPAGLDRVLRSYEKTGFGYVNYSDECPTYGLSLSSPAWVMSKLVHLRDTRISYLREHAWGHHDVYGLVKAAPI
jgi:SAM-dependent methyltransferase